MRVKTALLLTAVCLASPLARAEEGRIPIFEPVVLDGSLTPISGRYVVTRNIVSGTQNVITILGTGIENIEIDLNGFTLATDLAWIPIAAQDVQRIVVRNGSLRHLTGAATSGIQVTDTGAVSLDEQAIVESVQVFGFDDGVLINGVSKVDVRDSVFVNCGIGIEGQGVASPGQPPASGTVERNTILNTAIAVIDVQNFAILDNEVRTTFAFGISLTNAPGTVIRGNRVHGARIDVRLANNSRITNNVVTASNTDGIFVDISDNVTVSENAVDSATDSGIKLGGSNGCFVARNESNDNGAYGLTLEGSDRAHVDTNTLIGNGDCGLRFDTFSTGSGYRGNLARGNGGPGAVQACGAGTDVCDESGGNDSFGGNLVPGPPPC